jgi:surface antigen
LLALFLLFILSIFLDDKPTSFHQKQKLTKASKKRPLQQENLACPSPPQRAGDRRLDKTKLSVANYNAEWLFIGQSPHSRQCPGEACTWKVIFV